MESGERGMNSVALTIINLRKEYRPSRGSNQWLPVLKSCALPNELRGSKGLNIVHVVSNFLSFLFSLFCFYLSIYLFFCWKEKKKTSTYQTEWLRDKTAHFVRTDLDLHSAKKHFQSDELSPFPNTQFETVPNSKPWGCRWQLICGYSGIIKNN